MGSTRFGLFETVGFISTVIISKIFFTSTMMIAKQVGTAAWYTTIISCIVSIIFFLFVCALLKRFQGKNLNVVFEESIGKIPGRILSLIFAAYLLYYAGMTLREFVEIIKAISLPYTPTSIIVGAFVLLVILTAYKGFESIVRMSYISFYPIIIGILLILVLAYPYYKIGYILPIAGNGISNSFITGFTRSSAYDEVVFLAFAVNSVKGLKNVKKAGVISLVISGIVFGLSMLCILMVFGYAEAGENVSNLYLMSRIIYFSRFFQRIDAIFIFIWVISSVTAVSVAFYFVLDLYAGCFKINDHKPLTLPFAVLLFTMVMIPSDLSEIIDRHMVVIKQYSFLLMFGVPILLLVISWLFKRRGVKNEA